MSRMRSSIWRSCPRNSSVFCPRSVQRDIRAGATSSTNAAWREVSQVYDNDQSTHQKDTGLSCLLEFVLLPVLWRISSLVPCTRSLTPCSCSPVLSHSVRSMGHMPTLEVGCCSPAASVNTPHILCYHCRVEVGACRLIPRSPCMDHRTPKCHDGQSNYIGRSCAHSHQYSRHVHASQGVHSSEMERQRWGAFGLVACVVCHHLHHPLPSERLRYPFRHLRHHLHHYLPEYVHMRLH